MGRTRNMKINLTLGVPDEDNEWQFSLIDAGTDGPAIFIRDPMMRYIITHMILQHLNWKNQLDT